MKRSKFISMVIVLAFIISVLPANIANAAVTKNTLFAYENFDGQSNVGGGATGTGATVDKAFMDSTRGSKVAKVTVSGGTAYLSGYVIGVQNISGWVQRDSHIVSFSARLDDSYPSATMSLGVQNVAYTIKKGAYTDIITQVSTLTTTYGLNIFSGNANAIFYIDDLKVYQTCTPSITSSNPAQGATVNPIKSMTVQFNNEMDNSALDASKYTLTGGTQSVSSVQKQSDGSYLVNFNSVLSGSKNYTLTISGLKDSLGQSMASTDIAFSTANVQLPSVTSPAQGSTVSPANSLTLRFNNQMDESALNVSNYTLSGGTQSIASIQKQSDGSYLMNFNAELNALTNYTLSITGLADILGQSMLNTSIAFSTSDYPRPNITSITPTNESISVALDTMMSVTFDSDMDMSTLTKQSGNISINGGASLINSIVKDSVNPRQMNIAFSGLNASTKYTVHFSDRIKSIKGKSIDAKDTWFYTLQLPRSLYQNNFEVAADSSRISTSDLKATVVNSVYQQGNSSLSAEAKINGWIKFNNVNLEVGKKYTVSCWVKRNDADANYLPRFYLVNGDNKTYLINRTIDNNNWNFYTVTFVSNTTIAPFIRTDSFSNGAQSATYFLDNVNILQENDPTLLPISTPANGAENVKLDEPIKMFFNNQLDPTSLTAGNIKMNNQAVTIADITSYGFTIVPGTPLKCAALYTITMNIKDSSGISMNSTTSFTTMPVFNMNSINFYKDYGKGTQQKLDTRLLSGNITGMISGLKNNENAAQSAVLYVCLYKDNMMIDADYEEISFNPNETKDSPPITLSVLDTSDGQYYIKAYLWEGIEKIRSFSHELKLSE